MRPFGSSPGPLLFALVSCHRPERACQAADAGPNCVTSGAYVDRGVSSVSTPIK